MCAACFGVERKLPWMGSAQKRGKMRYLPVVCVAIAAGCSPESIGEGPGGSGPAEEIVGEKGDRWNSENAPTRFNDDFDFVLADLPDKGEAPTKAWPSSYFPNYQDSINDRWNGSSELSPAEKYDKAFNGWTPEADFMDLRPFRAGESETGEWDPEYYEKLGPLANYISNHRNAYGQNQGNLDARDGVDSDDDGEIDELDDNDGVETWFGLCHAWVPASILEDRPLKAVEHNGVTFEVGDLEALLILAYDRTPSYGIGGRCNDGTDEEDNAVERDEHGRALNVKCRDTNPGSFHVILANYLGKHGRMFAEDVTYDFEVWNQPVVSFEVDSMTEVSVADAHRLLNYDEDNCFEMDGTPIDGCQFLGDTDYAFNPDATTLYDVRVSTGYIVESWPSTQPADPDDHTRTKRYTYILEVDADGKIIGGEWYGRSRTDHPDFLWSPRKLTRSSVSNLDLEDIRMLVRKSREDVTPTEGKVFKSEPDVAIPDNDTTGVSDTIEISESFDIDGLNVSLDITHTYRGDLVVELSKGSTTVTLHDGAGGSQDDLVTALAVSDFDGQSAQGTWTLTVRDTARVDTGTLNSWSLGFQNTEPPSPRGGTFESTARVDIPDGDRQGVTTSISVPSGTQGAKVEVAFDITHSYIGDLAVYVQAPDGQYWELHNQSGGRTADIQRRVELSPGVTGPIEGEWKLWLFDVYGQYDGYLNRWSITFSD